MCNYEQRSDEQLGRCLNNQEHKSAQRGSFGPDIPADVRPKTSVRPSKSWQNKHYDMDIPRGRPCQNLGLKHLRADVSSLPKSKEKWHATPPNFWPQVILRGWRCGFFWKPQWQEFCTLLKYVFTFRHFGAVRGTITTLFSTFWPVFWASQSCHERS